MNNRADISNSFRHTNQVIKSRDSQRTPVSKFNGQSTPEEDYPQSAPKYSSTNQQITPSKKDLDTQRSLRQSIGNSVKRILGNKGNITVKEKRLKDERKKSKVVIEGKRVLQERVEEAASQIIVKANSSFSGSVSIVSQSPKVKASTFDLNPRNEKQETLDLKLTQTQSLMPNLPGSAQVRHEHGKSRLQLRV